MDYDDSGHVPHARWIGETPNIRIAHGPQDLRVRLLDWGPRNEGTMAALYCALQANWGENPVEIERDDQLTNGEMAYINKAFSGGTLQQALERFTFNFMIDGCTRAATHQLVRTRMGAAFMQHGGRDNDWRHRAWTMPETMRRADDYLTEMEGVRPHCLTDPTVLERYLDSCHYDTVEEAIFNLLSRSKDLYAAMVDAGIPWQDARRILPIGTQTYIFADYNYVALKGVLANRLEHVMDWEINCIAQLMHREIYRQCPAVIAESFGSRSDQMGRAAFKDMDSWPPDGKYPVSKEEAERKREHERLQMPYFVLHPSSLRGMIDEVVWVPTNGTYPTKEEFDAAIEGIEEDR